MPSPHCVSSVMAEWQEMQWWIRQRSLIHVEMKEKDHLSGGKKASQSPPIFSNHWTIPSFVVLFICEWEGA